MTRDLPDWQPFPLDDGDTSPLELSGMRGSTLVILGFPEADESGWAVRAAARIARQRAGRKRRLLLADLDLEHPRLHMELGTDDGEGVTDLLLYGASLKRVARPVDPGFLFVSAGTAVADPAPALTSPRLEVLIQGFEEADAELFLFLPWTSPARDRVLSAARNIVVLAEREEVGSGQLPELEGLRIGAVLGPGSGTDDDASPTPAVPAPAATDDAGEGPAVDARPTPDLAGDPAETDAPVAPVGESPRQDRTAAPPGRRTGSPWRAVVTVLGILLVVLAALVAAALFGLVELPGVPALAAGEGVQDVRMANPDRSAPGVAGETSPAPPTGDVGSPDIPGSPGGADVAPPASPVSGTSVAVGSYRELAPAAEQAAAYGARSADALVYVAPVLVDGVEWFRLLADPRGAPDGAAQQEGLADEVSRALGGDPAGWFLRPTALAFALGEAPTLAEAHERVSELAGAGVPAYALAIPAGGDAGTLRFRVYAGGYANEAEAGHMRTYLRERGVPDAPLVPRTGRIPDPPSPPSD